MKRNEIKLQIYKSYLYYTHEEENEFIKDLKDIYPEYNDKELFDLMLDCINEDYSSDLMRFIKYFDEKHPDTKYRVDISFGTWRGVQEGYCITNSLLDAFYKACNNLDDINVYEDGYGKFIIEGAHHDSSSNHMEIYMLKDGKKRNIHFYKETYGAGY